MSTLVTIQPTDLITNSRADINGNFSALNADKIETSVIDTDSTLSANSDAKIPSQKAVKAYVDAGGNVNASTTTKGIVELATSAEIDAGTATGGTGAALVVTADALKGSLAPVVRTYLTAGSPHTWSKPSGLKYIIAEVQGAGGSGGTDGAGGGGGGYSKKVIAAASLGSSETVTVGAGSVGSGNTSFGTHVTGGNGGNASGTSAGSGGTAASGDLNINGQGGGQSQGGEFGGAGGNAVLGFGAPTTTNLSVTAAMNGAAGAGYGGGGAGGSQATDGTPSGGAGGAGAPGIVIVTEYYV